MTSKKSNDNRGFVSEIFSSVQGEGIYVGERQIFLRTAGCSEDCSYCDTKYAKNKTDKCIVYDQGKGKIPNPLSISDAMGAIESLMRSGRSAGTVSITGGEPLEQPHFVAGMGEELRKREFLVYLDTNGLVVQGMKIVISNVDIVAMDIKLPSSLGRECWNENAECLDMASAKKVFVKVVIDENTTEDEVGRAIEIIAGVRRNIPLVLQPESAIMFSGREESLDLAARIMKYQEKAMEHLDCVRIIPQCHRILGVR